MTTLLREMGLDRAEFLRLLPAAVGHDRYTVSGDAIQIEDPAGTIRIRLHPTRTRQIAGLSLPLTPVEFHFGPLPKGERQRFLEHFDRHYQRGGG